MLKTRTGGAAAVVLAAVSCTNAQDAVQWRVEDGGNGHWYLHVRETRLRTDAAAACASRGGHLIDLYSNDEANFARALGADTAWIGIIQNLKHPDYQEPDGGWFWDSGTVPTYTEWRAESNEPNDLFGIEHAACMAFDSIEWNDVTEDSQDIPSFFIEWSADCNDDGIVDYGQILDGSLGDDDQNGVPNICEVLEVPGEYATIQEAVDAAPAGAVIEIAAGTWFVNVDLPGRDLNIVSVSGPDDTILDGGNAGSIFRAVANSGSDIHVDGFTFVNGSGTSIGSPGGAPATSGGAIFSVGEQLSIADCRFEGNTASYGGAISVQDASAGQDNCVVSLSGCTFVMNDAERQGGGIVCSFAELVINQCSFEQNRCIGDSFERLGGALAAADSIVLVRDSDFEGNEAAVFGGAIEVHGSEDPLRMIRIVNSNITANTAGIGGGGIAVDRQRLELSDSRVANNIALGGNGGGIDTIGFASISIERVVFIGNLTQQKGVIGGGGALAVNGESAVHASMVAFIANRAGSGGAIFSVHDAEIHLDMGYFDSNEANLPAGNAWEHYSSGGARGIDGFLFLAGQGLWENRGAIVVSNSTFCGLEPQGTDGGGNVFDSDCSRADCTSDGVPDYVQIFDGTYPDENGNGVPDCCDEGVGCDCPADITGDGQVDAADLGVLLAVWNTGGGTIPEADINRDGTVNASDLGLLLGAWGLCS